MNTRFRATYLWSWISVTIVIALIAAAWFAGRASVPSPAQAAVGYDIGMATQPKPTGTVREFQLVAKQAPWEIAQGVTVPAITYNGQVPGPLIRVTEGDTLRVTIKNDLDQATAIHWHGLHVPNTMDGVPPLTQQPIEPGASFTYEFPASHAGTFMYHSHLNAAEQIDRGLYGTLIIDPAVPTKTKFDKEFTMMIGAWNTNATTGDGHAMEDGATMSGQDGMAMDYNYFTINGKAFPLAAPWTVKKGDLVRVRIMNISNLVHPMHLHGGDFTVIAKDGEPIRPPLQQTMNTLPVNAGETFDIVFRADNPGTWVFHCHELHHTENNGVEPGGLIQVIQYEGFTPPQTSAPATSLAAMPSDMPGMSH
jgi:manganese oxidase